jgi:hypothetical protein
MPWSMTAFALRVPASSGVEEGFTEGDEGEGDAEEDVVVGDDAAEDDPPVCGDAFDCDGGLCDAGVVCCWSKGRDHAEHTKTTTERNNFISLERVIARKPEL